MVKTLFGGQVPFRVSKSGVISTSRKLDREDSESYTLTVIVTDTGFPVNTVTTTVSVVVNDVNDNAPVFEFQRYSGEIVEDDSRPIKNQMVSLPGGITATDADGYPENRDIVLSLSGKGSQLFTIDSDTGLVSVMTSGSIDCEVKCSYNLKVHARDHGGTGLSGEADLNINVIDVNDNIPTFPAQLTFNLGSLTPKGTHVAKVKAVDKDRKSPNNVVLHMLTEGGDGKFEVDPDSGNIKLSSSLLDEPRRETYTLQLRAFDFGNPSHSANTTLTFHVPLNFEPTVDSDVYFSVAENVSVGISVGQIIASDKNVERGENDFVRFLIDERALADSTFPFRIDLNTGVMTTQIELDRETDDSYDFVVYVTDSLLPVYTSSASVHVRILDENDSPPQFTSKEYTLRVLEDDSGENTYQILKIFPDVSITDIDTPLENIEYSIGGNGSELFEMNPSNGEISLRSYGTMDSERQQEYNLTTQLIASDGRFFTEVSLTVTVEDVNEHAPVFLSEVTLNISSMTPVGSVIGEISASDEDVSERNSDVMYFVTKGGIDKFAVHPKTGEIQLQASLVEEPFQDKYLLNIRATDMGLPRQQADTTVTIYVPVNYKPEVSQITELVIPEDLPVGGEVGKVQATDRNAENGDGDWLKFFISAATFKDIPFEIDLTTGVLTSTSTLDRETTDTYSFLVLVTDSKEPVYTASTTVKLGLSDVNDNPPVFSCLTYTASVTEDDVNPGIPQVVYLRPSLEVTDGDSSDAVLTYTLSGNGSDIFTIDSRTGRIQQKDAGSLDADAMSSYNLTLTVDDGVNWRSASLSISVEDFNDHAPVVTGNVTARVDPLSLPGKVVAAIDAEDSDISERNRKLSYYMLSGGKDRFKINEKTGEVSTTRSLADGPLYDEYQLDIRVVDHGYPQQSADVTLTLDVPVNFPPMLDEQYIFRIPEHAPVGSAVGDIIAYDRNVAKGENEILNYFIKEPEFGQVPFSMETSNGHLSAAADIDREEGSEYHFTVLVTDSLSPVYTVTAAVTVVIQDINDNPPVFDHAHYGANFPEDRDLTKDRKLDVMPVISVTDPDGSSERLEYSLAGHGSELFHIDPTTGSITLRANATFDAEDAHYYNLTVIASDGKHLSNASLDIVIEDVNDNAPVFNGNAAVKLDPFTESETVVGYVSAADADVDGRNSDVRYFLLRGGLDKFEVDEETGELKLLSSLMSEPKRSVFNLTVRAFDMGSPQQRSESVINIRVPVNYQPRFESTYNFKVKENITVGVEFGQVKAYDENVDIGDDDKLKYFIDERSTKGVDFPFYIEQDTGRLVVANVLDREKDADYDFTVFVTDAMDPVYTSSTMVSVAIENVNNKPPVFTSLTYTASILEDDGNTQSPVLSVTPDLSVIDGDTVDGSSVVLSLEGPGRDVFTIDSVTYELSVVDPTVIDCENVCEYNLRILATDDDGFGLQSHANLTITVIDVNDNAPIFAQSYNFRTSPEAVVGTVVGIVEAVDLDGWDGNNRVVYLLTGGGAGKFSVSPSSGEVLVADSLIRDPIQDVYKLRVQARDSGYPSLYENTEIIVEVSNNKPPVVPYSVTLAVDENIPVGGYLGEVTVTDPDASAQYPVTFSLLDHLDTFQINSITGRMTTVQRLDAERDAQYNVRVLIEDPGVPIYVMTSTITISVVDINDNHPQFSSPTGYMATIKENDVVFENVALNLNPAFAVTDTDIAQTSLYYQLNGEHSDDFTIDMKSGDITIASGVDIDCERVCHYNLHINVTDDDGLGLASTASLQITVEDINDNPPNVTSGITYHVPANASVGYIVGHVQATDLDHSPQNNNLTYLLTGGGFGKFAVGFNNGIITVEDSLAREPLLSEYSLKFIVRDSGFPSLSSPAYYRVQVPINRSPVFRSKVVVEVPEDVDVGYIVADVSVDDPDFDDGRYFAIDQSGMIRTVVELDAEHTTVVDMTAVVVDRGIPDYTGTTTVHVDIHGVNDNLPTFSSKVGYTATIREDVGLHSTDPVELILTPGLSVTDGDGDDIHLFLLGGGAELFDIDQQSHSIKLMEPDSIDCEQQCVYNLSIVAADTGSPSFSSSAQLTVKIEDVNEHAPVFEHTYVFPVPVESLLGTLVGYVSVEDNDFDRRNSEVSYTLKSGGFDKFEVHATSGAITVADSLIREPQLKQYDLLVEARDSGYPQRSSETTVVINVPVNEEPQLPDVTVYDVPEDTAVGDVIGTVTAEDVDLLPDKGQYLEYRILEGDGVFTVDGRKGEIILSNVLDAETKNTYNLQIKVEDHGYPSRTTTGTLVINVADINDHPPVFSSPNGYIATISESVDHTITPIVEIVPDLSAVDDDVNGSREKIRFGLEGVGSDVFSMDPSSGELKIRPGATLDAEVQQLYNLTITATDDDGAGLTTPASLQVIVEDVNDNAPRFDYTHNVKVSPRSLAGHNVVTVQAIDDDASHENNRLLYFLHDGMGRFRIDPLTGTIYLTSKLTEVPLRTNYDLTVKAVDSGYPPKSANTTVHVTVDLNLPPVYDTTQTFHLSENKPPGTAVGRIQVEDPDDGVLEFTSLDLSVPLTINRTTGLILTTGPVDRELVDVLSLPVLIVDDGDPPFSGTTVVTVQVVDVNDNSPTFNVDGGYHGVVPEVYDTFGPYVVYLNRPIVLGDRDADVDPTQMTLTLSGPGSDLFQVDETSGHLHLLAPDKIDSESISSYNLTLTAVDKTGGKPMNSSIQVLIDVEDFNDNTPQFDGQFYFKASTNTPVGAEIGTITATDIDVSGRNNKITYILKSGGYGKFDLGSETGVLTLSDSILREPVLGTYILRVQAVDSGQERLTSETLVTVKVPVNSPPTIRNAFDFSIAENEPRGSVAGEVTADDPDFRSNPYESHLFSVLDVKVPFAFKDQTGILLTTRSLDRETAEYFSFLVHVVNPGSPSFTVTTIVAVTVNDVNDNVPVFDSPSGYEASMLENTHTEFLDMRSSVRVKDGDATEENRLVVLELGGDGSKYFTIDQTSGRIKLRTPGTLDAEEHSNYNLTITATDKSGKGLSSTASLAVKVEDVNDHSPVFSRQANLSVAAGTKVGAVVGKVVATDEDVHRKNSRITYLLRGGALGKFDLDPDSGEIVVLEDLTVTPFRHVYHLSVEATDSGDPRRSSESIVTISVRMNRPPVVPTVTYLQAKENQTVGSVAGRVTVTDPDTEFNPRERLEYFSGEPKVPFTVERDTGIIRMATELDRETNDHFEMPIVIVNKGSPTYTVTSHVVIDIIDINDNAPTFSAARYTGRVKEDQIGTDAATEVDMDQPITVVDNDIMEINKGIVLNVTGPGSDQFNVDQNTGRVFINRPGTIDCEVNCQYNLTIYATDQHGNGLTSKANLTIVVEDINDNVPIFMQSYNYSVSTGAPVGSEIGFLVATDKDSSTKNNRLTYLLLEGGHGKFDLNPLTGLLSVSDTLKREPYREVFILRVSAIDNGFPRQSSDTLVTINVPMNKAPIVKEETSLSIAENLPVGSMVGKITADDPDSDINSQDTLEYSIYDSSVPFEVDRLSGELKLLSKLDREEQASISFNVHVVNDGAPSHTTSTMVTVMVNDTNDHAPEFTIKGGYSGIISEAVSKRDDVYVKLNHPIIVEDKDETSEYRNVQVELSGPGADNFILEMDTGKIRVKDPSVIDAEIFKTYIFKVTATDQGGKGFSTSSNLTITVDDVNDNAPTFVGNATFTVDTAATEGYVVGAVVASDGDVTEQNRMLTYILRGGGSGKFAVNSNTGEITVVDSLLRQPVLDAYQLKVKVQDNGVPQKSAETVVTINVPVNHPPRFLLDLYEFRLQENNAIGAVVGTATAVDPDIDVDVHHRLTFSVDNTNGLFKIAEDNGMITADDVLDAEDTSEIEFDVYVKDNVYPEYRDHARVKVVIEDVNDHPPILTGGSQYHGTVFEDDKKPIRSQIVKLDKNISVVDSDSTVKHRQYVLELGGHASKFFTLNPTTGEIRVKTPGSIDREFNKDFVIQIHAIDTVNNSLSSLATLHIDVVDSNDNYPEFLESTFTFTLPSVVQTGDVAGKVVARDIDATEPNNKILYLLRDNPLGKFQLDINTGELTLLQSFFSKPRRDAYTVTVEARDMGFPSRKAHTTVVIRAPYFDFNDYPPDFTGKTMFVTREEISVGSIVGRLNVVDRDRAQSDSGVKLELLSDSATGAVPFEIQADGSITCKGRIDRDLGPKYYMFSVRATDTGMPPFNITRDVSVIVDDINDNPPTFPLKKYKHVVSDAFPVRTVVATPFAFDTMDEKDSVYEYSMSGDKVGYFHIDERTGVVITTDMAYTLKPQTMHYQIEAVDLYNQNLKAKTELEIQVLVTSKSLNSTC